MIYHHHLIFSPTISFPLFPPLPSHDQKIKKERKKERKKEEITSEKMRSEMMVDEIINIYDMINLPSLSFSLFSLYIFQ